MRSLHTALAHRGRLAGLAAGALVLSAGAAFAAPPPLSAGERVAVEPAPQQPAPQQPAECPEGLRNHGEHVSSVAGSVEAGPGHGQLVSAAARGSCGKGLKPVKPPKASPDEKAPKAQKSERPVRGHEREGHRGRGPAGP